MRDCKYRLPCNWCDKYDRMCETVLLEIYKQEQKENVGYPETECKHNWVVEKAEAVTKEEAGCTTYYTHRCSICGKERIKRVEFDGRHRHYVTIWELKT